MIYVSHSVAGRMLLLAAALTCLLFPIPIEASSVTISVATVQAPAGDHVEVPVMIRGAQKLGALQTDLIYDPSVLEAKSLKMGSVSQNITIGSNTIEPGRFRMVMNTSAAESISGDGILMAAVFSVTGQAGSTCELVLEHARAWDNTAPEATPYEMLVITEAGSFTVSSGGVPKMWLFAGVALAVIVAVLLLLTLRSTARKASNRQCPQCGRKVPQGSRFCSACGATLIGRPD